MSNPTKSVNLVEQAMLVRHTKSAFGKSKTDKTITEEVAANHGADKKKAGRYTKILIDKTFLDEVTTIGRESYQHHIANTLQWTEPGSRILPAKNYLEYTMAQTEYRDRYMDAAYRFVKGGEFYEGIQEARTRLGTMFDPEDYPDEDTVLEQFNIEWTISPLPEAAGFHCVLDAADVDKIRTDIEARMQKVATDAIQEIWGKLREAIENLRDKLEAYEEAERKVFMTAWIDNVSAVIKILPRLDFTGDPKLIEICKEAELKLTSYSVETMKASPPLRRMVAEDADKILDVMSDYLGVIDDGLDLEEEAA